MPTDPGATRIKFHCICGKKLWAPAAAAGKKFRCHKCGQVNHIPTNSVAQPAPGGSPGTRPEDDTGPAPLFDLDDPAPVAPPHHRPRGFWDRVGAVVSGAALLGFLGYVILYGPKDLPPFRVHVLGVLTALTAGMFAYFLSGTLHVGFTKKTPLGEFGVKSTGGAAAFVLVLGWWVMWPPITPVNSTEAKATQAIEAALQAQMGRVSLGPDGKVLVKPMLADVLPEDVQKELAELRTARSPYLRGLVALTESRFDDARRELEEAEQKKDADLVKINLARGRVDRQEGRWPAATEMYEKVLGATPGDPAMLNEAGVAAYLAGNSARARELFDGAIDRLVKELGGAYTGQRDRAQLLADARLNLASAMFGSNPAEAEKQTEGAIEIMKALGEPDPIALAGAYTTRGMFRLLRGATAEAEADIQRAIKLYEAAGPAYRGRVDQLRRSLALFVFAEQRKYTEATEICQAQIERGKEAKLPAVQLAGRYFDLAKVNLGRARFHPEAGDDVLPLADRRKYLDAAGQAVEEGLALLARDSGAFADGLEVKADVLELRVRLDRIQPGTPPVILPEVVAQLNRKELPPVVALHREVLAIRERQAAADPSAATKPALAKAYSRLAGVLVDFHEPRADEEAESLYIKAIALRRQIDGGDSLTAALWLTSLAYVSAKLDKPADASRAVREAFAYWQKAGLPVPEEQINEVQTTYRLLHATAMKANSYAKAEDTANEFLELKRSLKLTITVDDALLQAKAYRDQHRYALARAAGEKAASLLPRDPRGRLKLVAFLAGVDHLQADYKRAIQEANEALQLLQSAPSGNLEQEFTALSEEMILRGILADANLALGKYREAQAHAEQFRAWCQKGIQETQPKNMADEVAQFRWKLRQDLFKSYLPIAELLVAGIYQAQGQFDKAAPLFVGRAPKDFFGPLLEVNPGVTYTIYFTLGNLYIARNQPDRAEPYLEESRKILEQLDMTATPDYAETLCRLGEVALARGKPDGARKLIEQAQAVWARAHGEDHIRVAEAKYHLARVATAEGQFVDAGRLLTEARQTFEKAFTLNHPWVARCLEELVIVYQKTGRTERANDAARTITDLRRDYPKPIPPK